MKRVGIKYCGGCNPRINRHRIATEITKRLSADYILGIGTSDSPWDIGILLCGCPVACTDGPKVRKVASRWVLVRGTIVDEIEVPEDEIPDVVLTRLSSFSSERRAQLN